MKESRRNPCSMYITGTEDWCSNCNVFNRCSITGIWIRRRTGSSVTECIKRNLWNVYYFTNYYYGRSFHMYVLL